MRAVTLLKSAGIALLLAGAVHLLHAAGADSVIVRQDIAYSERDSGRTRLDLYLPAGGGVNRPGVLLIHGGGWQGGNKSQWAGLARVLVSRGFVCASAGYRLAPEHRFPAAISDVRLAMDFFKSRAAEYGINPQRIGAVGSSAGGHLVALLSTIDPEDRLGDPEGQITRDTRPQAVACYNPVLDFTNEPLIWSSTLRFLGVPPEGNERTYYESSPALRVKGEEPPFLFLYGSRDILTPEPKSRAMISRLAGSGIPVEVAFFHGMEHGFGYSLRLPEQIRAAHVVADFFERWLK
ncbi:MAG TPA: alpha/beta hydrolase [archaeon]|nr:alpha/beta hydrolase [archaeon]